MKDWLDPVLHFLSFFDLKDAGLVLLWFGYATVRHWIRPFWEPFIPRHRPPGPLTSGQAEQIKIFATYLNTVGAGFMVTGVVGPVATYLYGTTKETEHSAAQLAIEIIVLLGLSIGSHLAARRVLRRLDQ